MRQFSRGIEKFLRSRGITGPFSVGASQRHGGLGLFVTEHVDLGDVVLAAPIDECISSTGANLSGALTDAQVRIARAVLADVGSDEGLDVDVEQAMLSLQLLQQLRLGQGSAYAPYLAAMPSVEVLGNACWLWPAALQRRLLPADLASTSVALRSHVGNEYEALRDALPGMLSDADRPAYEMAQALTRSRSFNLMEDVLALHPGIDLANHAPEDVFEPCYDEGSGQMLVLAGKPLSRGMECYISYGLLKSNESLLMNYGFLTPERAHDCCIHSFAGAGEDKIQTAALLLINGCPPELDGFEDSLGDVVDVSTCIPHALRDIAHAHPDGQCAGWQHVSAQLHAALAALPNGSNPSSSVDEADPRIRRLAGHMVDGHRLALSQLQTAIQSHCL